MINITKKLLILGLCLGCIIIMFALCSCGRQAPIPIESSLVGCWVGDFNPVGDLKPNLPAGTIHTLVLNADGTCHFEGFIELLSLASNDIRIYSGDGHWQLNQKKNGQWYVIITQQRGEYRHEEPLRMVWMGKTWELSLEWTDPDLINDLRFKK